MFAEGKVLVVGPDAADAVLDHLTEELVRRGVPAWPVALPWDATRRDLLDAADDLPEDDEDLPLVGVVFVPLTEGLEGTDPVEHRGAWQARCEALLLLGLHVSQGAYDVLDAGGNLVFVLPDVGLTGAAGQVPLATAAEGLRALVKSAGRQWADAGITTATVVVPPDAFDPDADPGDRARSIFGPDAEQVADVIAALLGPAGAALTGVTLPVDGGSLMVP